MRFIDRLETSDSIKHAYKTRHKEKYVRYDWKDHIIEERQHINQDRLTLYAVGMKGYNIVPILEAQGRVLLSENPSDIIVQCQKCFEYDVSFDFYKYDTDKLGKVLDSLEIKG